MPLAPSWGAEVDHWETAMALAIRGLPGGLL